MNGFVDEKLRSILTVPVSASLNGERRELTVWIDTALIGGLVIPRAIVSELGLEKRVTTQAILADGSITELETFSCFIDWFGQTYETLIAAGDGEFPLLGTILLDGHHLSIDYKLKTISLS